MNKLCRYNNVLTVLLQRGEQYWTYPIEDYSADIPEVVPVTDPAIELITISKLHFTEARKIIRLFVDDISVENIPYVPPVIAPAPDIKPALGLHAMYNREY